MTDTENTREQIAEEINRLRNKNQELERKVERITTDLQRTQKELGQFAYAASHDLQEPLRMVSSYMQLLERKFGDSLDDLAKEFIYYAVDGASRMSDMINGLLVFSRVGTQGAEFAPVDCEAVLENALSEMRKTIGDAKAEITSGSLPTVSADRKQLVMLFANLIDNAIKFVENGANPIIRIAAELEPDGKFWLFSFRDNGVGIEAKDAEKIFVVFQRLHTRGEFPGTGMGLAVCKKIVERHGGRIWMEPGSENGSVFFFTLPKQPDCA